MKISRIDDIKEFDILKIFHFIGSRNKKHYIYKIVMWQGGKLVVMDIVELGQLGKEKAHVCRLECLDLEITEIIYRGVGE